MGHDTLKSIYFGQTWQNNIACAIPLSFVPGVFLLHVLVINLHSKMVVLLLIGNSCYW